MNKHDLLYNLGGISSQGPRQLMNSKFDSEKLDCLVIGPGIVPDGMVVLENCSFERCVICGDFRIARYSVVSNVLFNDVRSPDSLTISNEAVLDNVVVKGGRKCAGLWVKPSGTLNTLEREIAKTWASVLAKDISTMLDFSGLEENEVEVVGLPLSKLRWNPEQHIALRREKFKGIDWDAMGISKNSYWRIWAKRLALFDASEGVFSLPLKSDKKYDQTLAEMLILSESGLLDE